MRAGVRRNRVRINQTTIPSRAQEPCALVPAPFNRYFMTWKNFGGSWMNCPLLYEKQGIKSLFYADNMVLLSPTRNGLITVRKKWLRMNRSNPSIVIFGRCPPTLSWLLFNNLWITFIHLVTYGYIFLRSHLGDSPGDDICLTLGICGCSIRVSPRPSSEICKMNFEKVFNLKLSRLNLMDYDIISCCGNRYRVVPLRKTASHRFSHRYS